MLIGFELVDFCAFQFNMAFVFIHSSAGVLCMGFSCPFLCEYSWVCLICVFHTERTPNLPFIARMLT